MILYIIIYYTSEYIRLISFLHDSFCVQTTNNESMSQRRMDSINIVDDVRLQFQRIYFFPSDFPASHHITFVADVNETTKIGNSDEQKKEKTSLIFLFTCTCFSISRARDRIVHRKRSFGNRV